MEDAEREKHPPLSDGDICRIIRHSEEILIWESSCVETEQISAAYFKYYSYVNICSDSPTLKVFKLYALICKSVQIDKLILYLKEGP